MELIPPFATPEAYLESARALFSKALAEDGLPQGMVFAAFSPGNPYAGLYDHVLGQARRVAGSRS